MRPLLIGMNNPLSDNPEHALFPHPPGCAGYRLWKMMELVHPGLTRSQYITLFERRDLVIGRNWDEKKARVEIRRLMEQEDILHRHVVWLGQATSVAVYKETGVDLHIGKYFEEVDPWDYWSFNLFPKVKHDDRSKGRWVKIPHPSGRNLLWAEDKIRKQGAKFLDQLVFEALENSKKATRK